MRRLILIAVLMALTAAVLAPPASAGVDYRPWKRALYRAYIVYTDSYWVRCRYPDDYRGRWVGTTMPAHMDDRVNRWDYETCLYATTVTAMWGVLPNGEWGSDMRAFLRPFLVRRPELSTLPTPPVVAFLAYFATPQPEASTTAVVGP